MMKRFTNQSNGSQAGRMYNGGAKFCRFALFPLMLLMLLLLPAGMVIPFLKIVLGWKIDSRWLLSIRI